MDDTQAHPWRSVEELVEIGFQRSRVVMMNEAHAGDLRCIRTRVIGQRILPTAYKMGARFLAMEALWPEITEEANLIAYLQSKTSDTKLLVWCGNSHHAKMIIPSQPDDAEVGEWISMGYQFKALSGIDPFVIDQIRTVHFPDFARRGMQEWLNEVTPQLSSFGGTAGFLAEEAPACFHTSGAEDAYIVSLENEME